mgnify:CR=1 FL=1
MLEKLGACRCQVNLFCAIWPEGVDTTVENIAIAFRKNLSVEWLAEKILPTSLWTEYLRQEAPLWAEYLRQKAPLLSALFATADGNP